MSNSLEGKTAIITGGTTGLGFETARRYVKEGARVLITGRSQEKIDAALAELGADAAGIVADSSDIAALDALAAKAGDLFGHVDILFANAGNGVFAPISDVDEQGFDHQFDLNVKGVFFTVQKILPLLRKGSSIILTASAVHEKGAPGGSIYFASKAAVRSFARTMAVELGEAGIRVNSISPGIVPTKFFANSNVGEGAYDQFAELVVGTTPAGRAGTPVEIANAAVFLGSDQASYVNAQDLLVDGGWMSV